MTRASKQFDALFFYYDEVLMTVTSDHFDPFIIRKGGEE